MPDDAEVLNYAKPVPASGVAAGLRILGATACVGTFLAGTAIVCLGALWIWHPLTDSPTRDRGYFFRTGAVICAVGLLVAGFSVRWFINAIRPKRSSVIDGSPPRE